MQPRLPSRQHIDISVIGHLRDVKDPLRAAAAARLLPATSRIRIAHTGRAYSTEWAAQAESEMAANPSYVWCDDAPRAVVQNLLRRSHAMVLSSLSEGGANVISEAVVAGVPVLASYIDGNVGLLGADYPGYFHAGDTEALARLLPRIERTGGSWKHLAAPSRGARPCSDRNGRSRPGGGCSPNSLRNPDGARYFRPGTTETSSSPDSSPSTRSKSLASRKLR
jgi:glycosyltransferase involved in cell wall biosynthesis